MSDPHYQEINDANIPVFMDGGAKVRVVAGNFIGTSGPVTGIAAEPLYMDITLEPGQPFSLPVADGHTAVADLFEGQARFGLDGDSGSGLLQDVQMVEFGDGDLIQTVAGPDSQARFMLHAGLPIKEPIVPNGPFMMNTEKEIRLVFIDLGNATFAQDSLL